MEAAAKALQVSQPHPLLAAARLSLLSVRCQYPQILHLAAALSAGPDPLSREAMARTHYQMADAHLYLHRYAEGARWAEQAAREARAVGMVHFAQVCDLLREECVASREENLPPEEREQTLRALIADPPSEQGRIEACMRLIRLMYRQGKYQKSLRLALEVPRELHGQGFVELGMILNRLDDELDWDKVASSGQLGRLRAIKGLIELAPDFILEGPPPPAEAPLHPRPMAEWQVAFGWACLVKGRYPEALRYFQSSFIYRSEWDLRLVRDVSLIALHLEAPALVEEHFNPLALIEEAAWLARERIWPESLVLRQIPRAAPYATALLLAIPGGCASLEPIATQSLAFAGPAGLTVNGVTHTNVQSILRLIEGNTEGMNSGALGPAAAQAAFARTRRAGARPHLEGARTPGPHRRADPGEGSSPVGGIRPRLRPPVWLGGHRTLNPYLRLRLHLSGIHRRKIRGAQPLALSAIRFKPQRNAPL